MSKKLKTRNPMATLVRNCRPMVIPDKRQRKEERTSFEDLKKVKLDNWDGRIY